MTPTLTSLLSRVRAASGPDRELDADIWQALCWQDHWREIAKGVPFTASIDAAVALVERMLPEVPYGWGWSITKGDERFQGPPVYHASVKPFGGRRAFGPPRDSLKLYGDCGATPPLAILAALLTALEQKETEDD